MAFPGVLINNTSATDDDVALSLQSGTAGKAWIFFGDSADDAAAQMWYDNNTNDLEINAGEAASQIIFKTASVEAMRIDNSSRVGIGNSAISSYTGDTSTLAVGDTGDAGASIRIAGSTSATQRYAFTDTADTTDQAYVSYNHGTGAMALSSEGLVGINEASNANMTQGLTIQQGTNDNEVLALKSSTDVAHGMTDIAETDTYGAFDKQTSTVGTLHVKGFTEGVTGMALSAYQTSENSERDSNCPGAIELKAWLKSGTGVTQPSADKNLVVIESGNATRFIFDSDGSAHAEVEWTTFDTHDDIAMLHDIEATLVPDTFGKAMKYDQEYLTKIGILGKNSLHEEIPGRTRGMINTTKLQMLHHGAIRQVHQQLQDVKAFYEDKIAALESRLLRLEA